MDKDILELIYETSDNFNDVEKTNKNIYDLTKIVSNLIFENDFDRTTEIKRIIEDEFMNKKANEQANYNLGSLHMLIGILNQLNKLHNINEITINLKYEEIEVLSIICEEKDISAVDIIENLKTEDHKHVGEILRYLKGEDLVNVYTVGIHKWYSPTLKGKRVADKLVNLVIDDMKEEL